MPITARLSRRFYDKFGDEIVNELVEWLNQVDLAFRSELRQVNETNFVRSDAKLDQRLAEFAAELRGQMQTIDADLRGEMHSLKAELRSELHDLRGELRGEMAGLRGEMGVLRAEMVGLRGETKGELHAMKAELMKWMFVFWAATALAVLLK